MKYFIVAAFGALTLVSALPTTGFGVSAESSLNSRDTSSSPVLGDSDAGLDADFHHRGGVGPAVAHPALSKRGNSQSKHRNLYDFGFVGSQEVKDAMRKVQKAAQERGERGRILTHYFYPGQLGWSTILEDAKVKGAIKQKKDAAPGYVKVDQWDGNQGHLVVWYN
ncbi:uncharacterized protein PpBr36_10781 [Pyricularia pennisetigena]|uniref:uncharacterized protein n=1 Tax=Pyricularia pennisetigena TaxID=1578925 RepID=UPI0011508C16|nr:uncharacterized protein PpBr36_10781 [Pyricularia pennisetigena]TLS20989.1 hypothetical protein PpBr36_10781 [Pyricularia pennisetigena]